MDELRDSAFIEAVRNADECETYHRPLVDLFSYLETCEPSSIKKSGPREYCLREHDSLKISNSKWFWFSWGVGSNNALDFLVQVCGMEFKEAAGDSSAPARYQAAPAAP